jgi:hypothetical protein
MQYFFLVVVKRKPHTRAHTRHDTRIYFFLPTTVHPSVLSLPLLFSPAAAAFVGLGLGLGAAAAVGEEKDSLSPLAPAPPDLLWLVPRFDHLPPSTASPLPLC